ncbi:MAG: flagellar basal body protein, partial [Syntrophorhabdaceae bacterium]|nr:flagellar basal body protein [Syntrophorhabdaceae bacterium]
MGMLDILKISASGLKAQRTRMEVIATNLSNIHSTRTEDGGPYKKKEVVFGTTDVSDDKEFGTLLSGRIEGVKVEEVAESGKSFERVFN